MTIFKSILNMDQECFFKQILKTITGVKLTDNKLKDELKHIEKIQNRFFSTLPYDEYEQWRELTINTYFSITAVKDAFDRAKDQTDQNLWLQAYDLAHKADTAIKELLKYKLDKFLFPRNNGYSMVLMMLMSVSVIPGLCIFIKKTYGLTQNQAEDLVSFIIMLLLLPRIINFLIIELRNPEGLETILVESYWCANILAEAEKIGIKINSTTIPKSQPWSNAQLLADIGCEDTPEEFDCIISYITMTKPVYCSSHKARFEKDQIDLWLRKKNKHPLTDEDLYWDELIPDKVLENKIANFTHGKTREFIDQTIMTSILERIEMESEDELSAQANQRLRI